MPVYSIHFSPTGGTKKVADRLISAWGDHIDIDLTDRTLDCSQFHFTGDDMCLITYPVFEGLMPSFVVERLAKMTVESTPCILAAVYGNRDFNDALLQTEDVLIPMGFRPFGAVTAIAKHSTLPYAIGRPDEADGAELEGFSAQLKERWQQGGFDTPVAVPGKRPYWKAPLSPAHYQFDAEKCTHCMTCAQLCITQAIDYNDPSIVDYDKCIECARCLNVCPTGAWKMDPERYEIMTTIRADMFAGRKPNVLYL